MIGLKTLILFLLFREQAILKIASSRKLWPAGLVFVFAAGLAREYDGEYLWAEPWHLAIPVVASLIACLSMVCFIFTLARCGGMGNSTFLNTFLSYLNLFWMTAPLALLYALPFERFCSPGVATAANLWLLATVATWRVALMIRCVMVLHEVEWKSAFAPVLLFCSILALLALNFVPGPIFFIMGGVRLSTSESLILQVRNVLGLVSGVGLLVCFVSYVVLCCKSHAWYWCVDDHADSEDFGVSLKLWCTAVLSVLVILVLLPWTQAEQRLRWQAERMIRNLEIGKLADLSKEWPASAFPPHWDPPPRISYGEYNPPIFSVLILLQEHSAASWMLECYEQKIECGIWPYGDRHSLVEEVVHAGSAMQE